MELNCSRRIVSGIYFVMLVSLATFSQVSFAQTSKWRSYMAEGDTLYQHDDFRAAAKAYGKAIDASKLEEKAAYECLYKRAICYYSIGEFENALKDLDTFIPKFPNEPRPKLIKAFVYRELGDTDGQLKYLSEAIKLQLVSNDILKWRGSVYLDKNEYAKAKEDFLLAKQMEDDAEVETYLGLTYYNLDKPDSSFQFFNRSIELDALYTPAYLYAGSIALESGDYSQCLTYVNLVLRLDSKNKEALFYKGVALVEQKKIDEGCQCLNRAFYSGMDDAADYLTEFCYDVEN